MASLPVKPSKVICVFLFFVLFFYINCFLKRIFGEIFFFFLMEFFFLFVSLESCVLSLTACVSFCVCVF